MAYFLYQFLPSMGAMFLYGPGQTTVLSRDGLVHRNLPNGCKKALIEIYQAVKRQKSQWHCS